MECISCLRFHGALEQEDLTHTSYQQNEFLASFRFGVRDYSQDLRSNQLQS